MLKMVQKEFQPAFGVPSTPNLIEIHNKGGLLQLHWKGTWGLKNYPYLVVHILQPVEGGAVCQCHQLAAMCSCTLTFSARTHPHFSWTCLISWTI